MWLSSAVMSPRSAIGQLTNSYLWQCNGVQRFESIVAQPQRLDLYGSTVNHHQSCWLFEYWDLQSIVFTTHLCSSNQCLGKEYKQNCCIHDSHSRSGSKQQFSTFHLCYTITIWTQTLADPRDITIPSNLKTQSTQQSMGCNPGCWLCIIKV